MVTVSRVSRVSASKLMFKFRCLVVRSLVSLSYERVYLLINGQTCHPDSCKYFRANIYNNPRLRGNDEFFHHVFISDFLRGESSTFFVTRSLRLTLRATML